MEHKNRKVALISLGCPKNLVNSEEMAALISEAGYSFSDDPAEADAVVINTCAFIESAKTEAIDRILETAALREINPELKIVVAGCLAQRYSDEIRGDLPEVDGILGTGSYSEIVSVLESVLDGGRPTVKNNISAPLKELPRVVSTGPAWAYLRIAEGCDNHCAYCVIPSLRGRYRSRDRESILAEARTLALSGVKELIVVAQDITRYGTDLYKKRCLSGLLRELCEMDFSWIRLHYPRGDRRRADRNDRLRGKNRKVPRYPHSAHQRRYPQAHEPPQHRSADPLPVSEAARTHPGPCASHQPDHGSARRRRGTV